MGGMTPDTATGIGLPADSNGLGSGRSGQAVAKSVIDGWRSWASLAFSIAALGIGVVLWLVGEPGAADVVWAAGVGIVLVPLTIEVVIDLFHGDVGVDLIALAAMAGTLAIGEYLAGVVVAIMLSGGNTLEAAAGHRASRELTKLIQRAPRDALVRRATELTQIPAADVVPGDLVVVRPGEIVPVDGVLVDGRAIVDESALTGEPLPVSIEPGGDLRSGTANAGGAIEFRAVRPASESAYATIVRLVRAAGTQRAPFVRMADRFAILMLPLTAVVAGMAWAISGDPVRAVAVLVVATPCPLILAAPIALISGVARAARIGVIVKGGGAIEQLGRSRTVLFDKTGTLTRGAMEIQEVVPTGGIAAGAVLSLAASVEQYSLHVTARAIVRAARERGVLVRDATDVVEMPGSGVRGRVEGVVVVVGAIGDRDRLPGSSAIVGRVVAGVWLDDALVGEIVMSDPVRQEAADMVRRLRTAGIRRIAMISGDRQEVADAIGHGLGLDAIYADQSPSEKVAVVRAMRAEPQLQPVVMVGDGINDAPALALADCGIALGAAGATVSSETADAVITVDRVDRVADAIEIGRDSLRIARESVIVGIGLSGAAMLVAAFGYLPPIAGALVQEAIDVAVILNALRALGPRRARARRASP
jgi:heavy metal translocating P-type ATPase